MRDYRGDVLTEAKPSCPARILGFKVAPRVGDVLDVSAAASSKPIDLRAKRVAQFGAEKSLVAPEADNDEEKKFLNVVVKADVLGSLEAIIGSLEKLKNDEVSVKVVGKGLGNITADDVALAETAKAFIFGFNVQAAPLAHEMIQEKNVVFNQYKIIYDLLDFVKAELEKLLNPEKIVTELGKFRVVAVFRSEKSSMILGGRVEGGKLRNEAKIRVRRGNEIIGLGKIGQLQINKQTVNEVPDGSECGIQFEGKIKAEVGDVLEAYWEEEKKKKLVLS